MAVTANQMISLQDGCRGSGPVAASTTLYEGTLCFHNATGYVDDDVAAGVNKFAGLVVKQVDNSAGLDGAKSAEYWQDKAFLLTGTGFTQATVGSDIYASDNYTVTTSSSGTTYIGKCIGYVSSTKIWVKLTVDTDPANVATLALGDDEVAQFGDSDDAEILFSTGDASNHALVIAIDDSSQALHITDKAAKATDWNIAATTHPNVYVHSNTTPATDYIRIGGHDGTTAEIDVVGGTTLRLQIAGTTEALLTASILDLASANLQMQTSGQILDDNGNELIIFPAAVGSAVNEITISNAATGNNATLTASGETNAGIDIVSKGTGFVGLKAVDTFAVKAQKDSVVKLGFFGVTPAARPASWNITSFTSDKAFAGDSTTAADAVKGLASLVNDLITLGLIDGTVAA